MILQAHETRPAHSWLSAIGALACFVVFTTLAIPALAQEAKGDAPPFPAFQAGEHDGAWLEFDRETPVLHAFGTPRERGRQKGTLMREQVRFLVEHYVKRFIPEAKREDVFTILYGLDAKIPEWLREEMRGIAEGSGLEYRDILLANSFVDTFGSMGCSTFAALGQSSATGRAIIGRNLDWPGLGMVEQADVIVVDHPAEGHAVISITWPGFAGTVTGLNDQGLVASMLVSLEESPRLVGYPNILAYRALLAELSTVEQADEFFERNLIISPNNLMLADAKGDALVMELDPYWGYAPRVPADGLLVCTNHFAGSGRNTTHNSDWRFTNLEKAGKEKPRHSMMDVRRYLSAVAPQKNAVLQNLQAIIFEPQSGVFYLSAQDIPAAGGKYLRFDTKPLFAAQRRPVVPVAP